MASDRPIRRQAIKLLARLLLGRRRAHYHSWLPTLRIVGRGPTSPGAIEYKRERMVSLVTLAALRLPLNRRVLIVGTGPSVRTASLEHLPPRQALLLNGAISLIGEGLADPLAVVIEDERFVWRHEKMIRQYVGPGIPMLLSAGVIRALCDIDPSFLRSRCVILIDDIRKPYGRPRRDDRELTALEGVTLRGAAGFSARPEAGVFQGGSVVVSALQFALAIAPAEIGLIGIDISNADGARFYERTEDRAFSGVATAERRVLDHIALARDAAAERSIRFVNHSSVSALRSIGLNYVPLEVSAE